MERSTCSSNKFRSTSICGIWRHVVEVKVVQRLKLKFQAEHLTIKEINIIDT